jgi:HEAT repeat protein
MDDSVQLNSKSNSVLLKAGVFLVLLSCFLVVLASCGPTSKDMYAQLKGGEVQERIDAAAYFADEGDDFAVRALIELLGDEDAQVRTEAIKALGKLKSEQAVQPLSSVLYNDTDMDVRTSALDALLNIGGDAAAESLVVIAQDKQAELRLPAIAGLGEIGGEDQASALIELLSSKDNNVVDAAADALIDIGSPAVDALIEELNNPDSTCNKVGYALCLINDPRAISEIDSKCAEDLRFVAINYLVSSSAAGRETKLCC